MPFGQRQPAQRLADHDAGIGDECVEPSETLENGGDHARRRFLDADVAFDERHVAHTARKGAMQPALGQIEDADPPTVAGEVAYDSLPYAVRASGHQGDGMRTRRHDALAAFDGKIGARTPFRPGAVVEALGLLADRVKRERQDRSGHAGAARGDDRLVEIDSASLNALAMRSRATRRPFSSKPL